MSATSTEEERRRRRGGSDITPLFDAMVSENLKTMLTVKGLLCRGGAGTGIDGALDIDKIQIQKSFQRFVDGIKRVLEEDPGECRKQYCIDNIDMTKDHVCPRLKYITGKGERIEGNTDYQCCDISFFDNIWFTIQDLFYF